MLKCTENLVNKIRCSPSKKNAVLLALIIAVAMGFYFFSEWIPADSVEICWDELTEPYVLIEKNYELYEVSQPGGPYQYFIFDNKHNIIDSGYTYEKSLNITMTHGLMRMNGYYKDNLCIYTYYDLEKGLVSWTLPFVKIISESKTMVAYIEEHNKQLLIVQDIFDMSKYYRTFARDFLDVENPITQAEFINGGKQLRITYKADEDEHEVTETLNLYD